MVAKSSINSDRKGFMKRFARDLGLSLNEPKKDQDCSGEKQEQSTCRDQQE